VKNIDDNGQNVKGVLAFRFLEKDTKMGPEPTLGTEIAKKGGVKKDQSNRAKNIGYLDKLGGSRTPFRRWGNLGGGGNATSACMRRREKERAANSTSVEPQT